MKMFLRMSVAVSVIFFSAAAFAAPDDTWYGGIGFVLARHLPNPATSDESFVASFPVGTISRGEDPRGWRIYAGYRFNSFVSFESGYTGGLSSESNARIVDGRFMETRFREMELRSLDFSLVAGAPTPVRGLGAFAGLGVERTMTEIWSRYDFYFDGVQFFSREEYSRKYDMATVKRVGFVFNPSWSDRNGNWAIRLEHIDGSAGKKSTVLGTQFSF